MAYPNALPFTAQAHYSQVAIGDLGCNGQIVLCTPHSTQKPPTTSRIVALKCYRPGITCKLPAISILQSLERTQDSPHRSPHLPRILDLQCYPEWYVMDYIHGCSLDSLRDYYSAFPDFMIAHIFIEIFEAIHFLQNMPSGGLRHVDIHAGNVMLELVPVGEGEGGDGDEQQAHGLPNVKLIDLDALDKLDADVDADDDGCGCSHWQYAESCWQCVSLLQDIYKMRPANLRFGMTNQVGESESKVMR